MRLGKVVREQSKHNNKWKDEVDNKIEYEGKKVCPNCSFTNDIQSKSCSDCGKGIVRAKALKYIQNYMRAKDVSAKEYRQHTEPASRSQKYRSIQIKTDISKHAATCVEYKQYKSINDRDNPIVHMLSPTLVNPNSYESIVEVLQDIRKQAGVKKYGNGCREYIIVFCDGCHTILHTELSVHIIDAIFAI